MIRLWDGSVRIFAFDQQLREPNVWSPDSAFLTVGIQRPCACNLTKSYIDLGVVDVNSGQLRMLTDGEFIQQDFRSVAWSPDATALVYVDQQFDPSMARADIVKWISVNGSEPARTLFARPGASSTWLRWLPDEGHIAIIAMASWPEIWFIDIQTAQVTFHYATTDYFETCWSTHTDHFIAASQTSFTLINPDGLPPLDVSFVDPSIWKQNTPLYDACAWSPDATKLVLIQANRPYAPIVQVIDFEKRSVSEIRVNHPARFLIPYWSPDSRMLAFKTYRPILDSGDTYIYDTFTMRQVYFQTHANFLSWLPELP
jgi:Tol biopolymer transport system component